MTRQELLLVQLAEECSEVAVRVSKALRFGLTEVQPGQDQTNASRIVDELMDLHTIALMLSLEGALPNLSGLEKTRAIQAKTAKIEKYLAYSKECGTLETYR
jgi:NTP pyrophosphatase (non-canonical NTP hydrolase)